MTKANLVAINKRAKKAGGNNIDPDFVALLPDRFKYPDCQAMPVPPRTGWVRCCVTAGPDDPVVEENVHTLLLDMPHEVYVKLPLLAEAAGTGKRTQQ